MTKERERGESKREAERGEREESNGVFTPEQDNDN